MSATAILTTISGTTQLPLRGDKLPNGKTVVYSETFIAGGFESEQAAIDKLNAVRETHSAEKGWVETGFRTYQHDTKWVIKRYHYKEEETCTM